MAMGGKGLSGLKMMLNEKKSQTAQKLRQLKRLKDKVDEIKSECCAIGSENNPLMQTLRQLENKLEKTSLKHNEALSIHKTYDLIIKRLQDERAGYDTQLATMQQSLRDSKLTAEEPLQEPLQGGRGKATEVPTLKPAQATAKRLQTCPKLEVGMISLFRSLPHLRHSIQPNTQANTSTHLRPRPRVKHTRSHR